MYFLIESDQEKMSIITWKTHTYATTKISFFRKKKGSREKTSKRAIGKKDGGR